jgi:hypothetical protein
LEALLRHKLVVGRTFAAVMMNGGGPALPAEAAAALETEPAEASASESASASASESAEWVAPRAEWVAPVAEWVESPESPLRKRARQ